MSVNPKYMSSRGRTYWTRGCRLLEDLVPDFMLDVGREVLGCGRAMNLLKLCVTKVRKKLSGCRNGLLIHQLIAELGRLNRCRYIHLGIG